MRIPTDLRIAGGLTPQLLDTIRAGLREPGEWDATVVAALLDSLERYRGRLAAAESDLLNVRGVLSPNGQPRRVPDGVEMVPTVAGAVEWLVGELDRLRRIINNVTVDLNDESYPLELRVDRASSHLLECPEAVFGEFPHGAEAAAKVGAS